MKQGAAHNKRAAAARSWDFKSAEDIRAFWSCVRDVPPRGGGRRHHHEEQYCLGIYLLALAQRGFLAQPLRIEQGESPDFMLTWASGRTAGLEVTKATEPWFQKAMTKDEREYRRREAEAASLKQPPAPVIRMLSVAGWAGDEAEREWCSLICRVIERKLESLAGYREANSHELLIYDDAPLPAVDRRKVMAAMASWVPLLREKGPAFDKVSTIVSLDLLFDFGGESQILPYIEWGGPKLDGPSNALSFAERVEQAGTAAVRWATDPHVGMAPISFDHGGNKIIKVTPEGRRFEVMIRSDGEEVVLREIMRE